MNTPQTNIVEQINIAHEQAQSFADTAKGNAQMAIQAALLCGRLLNQAKGELEHGEWEQWREANVPDISKVTACKYMKFAKVNHGLHLESCASLTQAYRAAGILPEPEPDNTKSSTKPPQPKPLDTWQGAINAIAQFIAVDKIATIDERIVDSIEDQLQALLNRIREARAK